MATPTYPPQGLQTKTSLTASTQTGKSFAVGANLQAYSYGSQTGVSAYPGGVGLTTFYNVTGSFTPTITATPTSGYNNAALLLTMAYTPPTSGAFVRGLIVNMDIYAKFTYQVSGLNNMVLINVYNSTSSSATPLFSFQPLQSSQANFNYAISALRPTSVFYFYQPSSPITSLTTLYACCYYLSGSTAATVIGQNSTLNAYSSAVYSRASLTTVYG